MGEEVSFGLQECMLLQDLCKEKRVKLGKMQR